MAFQTLTMFGYICPTSDGKWCLCLTWLSSGNSFCSVQGRTISDETWKSTVINCHMSSHQMSSMSCSLKSRNIIQVGENEGFLLVEAARNDVLRILCGEAPIDVPQKKTPTGTYCQYMHDVCINAAARVCHLQRLQYCFVKDHGFTESLPLPK